MLTMENPMRPATLAVLGGVLLSGLLLLSMRTVGAPAHPCAQTATEAPPSVASEADAFLAKWGGMSASEALKPLTRDGVPVLPVPSDSTPGKPGDSGEISDSFEAIEAKFGALAALRAKADKGDPEAQFQLAQAYARGAGIDKDPAEAVRWLRKAAEQGHTVAQLFLALHYDEADGVPKDSIEAARWYRKAAEQGHATAQFNLGLMYTKGEGVAVDPAEAATWYRKSAEQGDSAAQYMLGRGYRRGEGVPKDPAEAARWYRKAAEQGHTLAQTNLATCYANGEGVPKDLTEAANWYRKAAEQGEAYAQFDLGLAYAKGEGVPKDLVEALRWHRKAADQGNSDAQIELGRIYLDGDGVPKDPAESVRWYRLAANQGEMTAQRLLADLYCYDDDDGVAYDKVEAFRWYQKAADQGDDESQYRIGFEYLLPDGDRPKDLDKAARWFKRAADQGNARAQYFLSGLLEDGTGVPKDEARAYLWAVLSLAQGFTLAEDRIKRLEGVLSRAEIAEAQRLAREFTPKRERGSDGTSSRSADGSSLGRDTVQAPLSTGSGFLVTTSGYVVTCAHVVSAGKRFEIRAVGGTRPARLVRLDRENDLAILKVDGVHTALPIAPSRNTKLGATVSSVGFPNPGLQGFSPKLSKGEIASLAGAQDDPHYFQVSVPLQPGNSGGALIDERGNVVGVVAAKLSEQASRAASGTAAENVNYAIKSAYLLALLESIPQMAADLPPPRTAAVTFEDAVADAERAAVLIIVR